MNHTHDYFGDPAFLDPNAGDYHVGLNSPAIDRGIGGGTVEDIDGDPRPLGSGYDIGADETGLIATKQSDPRTAQLGAPLTYTIRITNYSRITLTATITDILPEHVTPGGNLVWTADITAPGGTWIQTVPVTIEMEHTGPLTNVVQVITLQGASGVYTHVLVPGLTVTKHADSDPVQAGEPLTYTIRITNTGDFLLHATITDTLPAQVTPTGVLTWTALITAPGGVWVQTVPVTATLGYSGTVTNTVEVATQEGATGTYTTTSYVQATAALAVAKQAAPDPVQAGAMLTYTIRVTNTGTANLHATITDSLPAQVTPAGVLTWTALITAPGGVWAQTVPVTATLGYSGTLTNTVEVATREGATGVYTVTSHAQATPALAVAKQAAPSPVQAGAMLTYTIRVTNTGSTDLHATITDSLPAQVTPTGILTWAALITAPSGVWMQTVPVTVTAGYSGTLTNSVEVTTDEGARGLDSVTVSSTAFYRIHLPVILKSGL